MPFFIQVALNLPVQKCFTYTAPETHAGAGLIGRRVRVPFGPRKLTGFVIGDDQSECPAKQVIKAVEDIIDSEPVVDKKILILTKKISDYYLCAWGEALAASLPGFEKSRHFHASESFAREQPFREKDSGSDKIVLNADQETALATIAEAIDRSGQETFLLHGVTASGKTEIYLRAISRVLAKSPKGGAIMLVPEISLTPQTVCRLKSRFGEYVAILHSAMTARERKEEWYRLKQGRARIAVGARSCVFAPLENVGIIIIDEEHETSYKQTDAPRYHARDVAIMRGVIEGCPVVLGSATPSLESYYRARKGEYRLICLKERVVKKKLPRVHVVDIKQTLADKRRFGPLSNPLETAIRDALARDEQVILFINRRGFATFLNCISCGFVFKCRSCDVAYVYHSKVGKLLCHYCGRSLEIPESCPSCRSSQISYRGFGTEKVESEIHRLFPEKNIARIDSDVTRKHGSLERILGLFKEGKIDILIGTQMIAKGLDYPGVTVVGVVMADISLNIPDFRSSERTFSLLTQVAGRSGRGEKEGEVLIQTFAADNYVLKLAKEQDYEAFYHKEISIREELNYPPVSHLAAVFARSRSLSTLEHFLQNLKNQLEQKKTEQSRVRIDGPAPRVISKVSGSYRWQLLVRGPSLDDIRALLRDVVPACKKPPGVYIGIDIDPVQF